MVKAEDIVKVIVENFGFGNADAASTFDDIGMDSLDKVELLMWLEEKYDTELDVEDSDLWKSPTDAANRLNEVLLG